MSSSQTTIVLGVDGTPVSTGTGAVDSGTIRVVQATGAAGSSVDGTKTNNNAPPGANNIGALVGVSTAAAPAYAEGNLVALSTDLAGALRVSGSAGGGVAQTQVRDAANAWTDVGYFAGDLNMPIQAASLPLPAGAATSALQTQPGVDIGDVTVNNAAGAAAVNVQDGGNSLTVDGTVTANQGGAPWSENVTQLGGNAINLGSGAAGTGTLRAILATDQTSVPVTDNAGSLTVDTTQLPAALVGGRLDGNVGAWLGSTAPSVGQKAMASSVPVALASDQSALSVTPTAGTLRIGGTYDVGGNVIDEVPTVRSVNRSFVNATASGNTSLVAAQGVGVRIRVLSVFVCTSTALTVKFQSAASDISCGSALAANGGYVMPENAHGWFQTNANEALNVNLSTAATNVGVQVIWVQAT